MITKISQFSEKYLLWLFITNYFLHDVAKVSYIYSCCEPLISTYVYEIILSCGFIYVYIIYCLNYINFCPPMCTIHVCYYSCLFLNDALMLLLTIIIAAFAFAELVDNALTATAENLGTRKIEIRLVSSQAS